MTVKVSFPEPGDKATEGPVQTPDVSPTESPPGPPKTPFDVIMERFDKIDVRLDQQAKAIVNIAEKVFASTPENTSLAVPSPGGLMGNGVPPWVGDLISMAKNQLGGDPMNEYFATIGKTVFDKTMESTMKRVAGSLAGETARHVVG